MSLFGITIDPNKYVVYQGKRLCRCDPCLDKAAVEPEKAILILKEQFGETLKTLLINFLHF